MPFAGQSISAGREKHPAHKKIITFLAEKSFRTAELRAYKTQIAAVQFAALDAAPPLLASYAAATDRFGDVHSGS